VLFVVTANNLYTRDPRPAVQVDSLFRLPGHEREPEDSIVGEAPGRVPDSSAQSAAHVENLLRAAGRMAQFIGHFIIHPPQHGFQIEGVHASTVKTEVHVNSPLQRL
jgi:hypothetical protein